MGTVCDLTDDFGVLAKKAAAGDQASFRHIYDCISGKMYSLCLRYAGNADDANDAFQEGFLKLYRNLSLFRNEGSFEGWARRIFVNTCLDYIKRRKSLPSEISDIIPPESADLNGLDRLELSDLLNLIQQLPAGYRTVFNLYQVEGFSHKEIGMMLGIAESGSKSQLHRAKLYLRKLLDNSEYRKQNININ